MAASENEMPSIPMKKGEIVRGVLSVTIISAEDLCPMDLMGNADPYVALKMKKSEVRHKTKVISDTLSPVWNQTFDFLVENGLHDMLMMEIWDHDTFGKDYMGRCDVTLTRVITEGEYADSYPLSEATQGKLNINLKWTAQYVHRHV